MNMKKLADQGKLQVIPIFYKVSARDVRKQTGEFGENFWTLAKATSGDQIEKWKEALESISDKMGLSLQDKCSEADFVKEIVKEVKKVIAAIGLEEKEENHFGEKAESLKRRNLENCILHVCLFQNYQQMLGRRLEPEALLHGDPREDLEEQGIFAI
ncbi:unnamed protein product [Thlaspi arvense]|uniref:TIR domain-containing protein n=1 Tax=Thlaspi arvense TaxID=13288 RepID=A0AAU9RM42_THLAR|nr:unnamed protein product [Thlaspi arvense]